MALAEPLNHQAQFLLRLVAYLAQLIDSDRIGDISDKLATIELDLPAENGPEYKYLSLNFFSQ